MTDYPMCCGRAGRNYRTASIHVAYEDVPTTKIDPVRNAVEGARAFSFHKGLGDPHEGIDYHRVMTHQGLIHDLGHAYDKLPLHDPKAVPAFHAMRDEVNDQYHHLTHNMGINVHVMDHDPYKDVHELAHDVNHNHQIKVLGTHATGGHPLFSNEENDRFRAVHDVFGHLATGRGFDRHGEEAAYQAHSRMFTDRARGAMASETRGQNGSLISNGHFGPQRIALLPGHLWHPGLARNASLEDMEASMQRYAVMVNDVPGMKVIAHVSGNQIDILHCPFCGSGAVIGRSDGTVECGYCTVVFTVQVQPQFNGFPQSVDGQPYNWPGKPEAPGDPVDPNDPDAMNDPNAMEDPTMAEPDIPDGTNLNPNTNGGFQSSDPADGGNDEDDDDSDDDDDKPAFLKGKGDSSKSDDKKDKKKGNPFAKKKSYRTATGGILDEDDYLAHLAIMFANDKAKVASLVKAARRV